VVDRIAPDKRSANMRAVRSANTKPEMVVRRAAHAIGFRFRLHRKDLPGTPDLVFPGLKIALFVHGCFWHRHSGCPRAALPTSNVDFWRQKLEQNFARDQRAQSALREAGWRVEVIWECELAQPSAAQELLRQILPYRTVPKLGQNSKSGLKGALKN